MHAVSNYFFTDPVPFARTTKSVARPQRRVGEDGKFTEAVAVLFNYIGTRTGMTLSHSEQGQLLQVLRCRALRRKQYLLQEGDVCKDMCFIVRGALRMYFVNERGQEVIISFGLENAWIEDKESLVLQAPSRYNIEAVEQSLVLQVHAATMEALRHSIPAIAEMLRIQEQDHAVAAQQRIHAAISMTAEERYQDMLNNHPEYARRFSQTFLAAYLGITPETLSRIRKR
jgi:CRP-like cAMP-binding protein